MTTPSFLPPGTADRMRRWATGSHPTEAGVELLLRSDLAADGRVASAWPRTGGFDGQALRSWVLDTHPSASEQRLAAIAASLIAGQGHEVDLAEALTGLCREELDLVLAALAHAGGSHEHRDDGLRSESSGERWTAEWGTRDVSLPPLHPWPTE